ncbi:FadR/GntR family transcriptional regulator [Desulfomonile tiedjei]|uniref:Transcriptional regulator n=1 Tax=Desulfomonile tiedjei (strain ATCC 49306 / DSM 6799 / DCB-1) TaxID=706587 RepID=I4C8L9_DESTA|nr:FCD domain-containing protein [Desulfomonile tiedjei]AFM25910.1 transcriptional regulator [Desulfomonile tiedjei DSM 6799]
MKQFKPLKSRKYAAEVAAQIKRTIFDGTYGPGDKLPSESQLAQVFEVSTVSIRQAIRVLESSGLVCTKRGAEGGVFVAEADTLAVSTYLSDMLQLKRVRLGDLTMARLIFEPEIASVAAEVWKGDELTELEHNVSMTQAALDAGEIKQARINNLNFHRIICKLTKNPVVIFTLNSVMDVLKDNVRETEIDEEFVRNELIAHKTILDNIRFRNVGMAHDQMRVHIRTVHERLSEVQKLSPEKK